MANIGRNLTQIHRLQMNYFKPLFEPYDISPTTFSLIINIAKTPGISQKQLCEKTQMDEALVARLIKKMEAKEIVYKKRNEEDLRAYQLFLSENGMKLYPQIDTYLKSWWDTLLKDLPEDILNDYIETMTQRALQLSKEEK